MVRCVVFGRQRVRVLETEKSRGSAVSLPVYQVTASQHGGKEAEMYVVLPFSLHSTQVIVSTYTSGLIRIAAI